MKGLLGCVLFSMALGWAAPLPASQAPQPPVTVRVRLVRYKNGKPVKGLWIRLLLGDPLNMPAGVGKASPSARTDKDGVATFHLAPPLPKVVFPAYDGILVDPCSFVRAISLQEILARGFEIAPGGPSQYGETPCKGNPQILERIQPSPGEILIFNH